MPPASIDSEELLALIAGLAREPGTTEVAWPGLAVIRLTQPFARTPIVYPPCLCVVAQGRKFAYLGDFTFEYNPRSYLLCSLPLPIESEIKFASPAKPVLAMVLKFDPAVVAKILIEMDEFVNWPDTTSQPAVAPCEMTPDVHRAICRFLEVVSNPLDRRILGSGREREFLFEVLRGPHGFLLRDFVFRDGSARRVSRAVAFLEANYRAPLDVKAIAKRAGMSTSALHEHFKRATAMSPIQFVKRMRLHQARALLLAGRGATEAAMDVGYTSPSQFSREFRRMFGHPPNRVRLEV